MKSKTKIWYQWVLLMADGSRPTSPFIYNSISLALKKAMKYAVTKDAPVVTVEIELSE